MSWGAVIGAGAGLIGGFLQNKGGEKQQQAAQGMSQADRDFYERMYKQSLGDNRPNQSNPWGSRTWTQDENGKWTQTDTLNPAEQGRLDDFRQIAADRMQNAKGLSANLPQGAMNWDAIGLGKIAGAAGVQGGGSSDAIGDARRGVGVIGQPGWQRQNPLIGSDGQPMGGPGRRMPTMFPGAGPSAGGGQIGQPNGQTPPGPAGLPGGRQPYTPAPITNTPQAPIAAPKPTAPQMGQNPQMDPNTPAIFQKMLNSGYSQGLNNEMFDYFGGDKMLDYAKTFDPNAKWTHVSIGGGGEGAGPSQSGRRLDFDPRLMAQLLKGGK